MIVQPDRNCVLNLVVTILASACIGKFGEKIKKLFNLVIKPKILDLYLFVNTLNQGWPHFLFDGHKNCPKKLGGHQNLSKKFGGQNLNQ